MKITFYGHACFGVEVGGTHILFDPFITPNEKAKHIDISTIKADYILLTHGHADHVADAIALAKQNDATIKEYRERQTRRIQAAVQKLQGEAPEKAPTVVEKQRKLDAQFMDLDQLMSAREIALSDALQY